MFFVGEYDIFDKGALRAALERLVDVPSVVLDLTEVRYVDSTAIGEFIRLHNERSSRGGARETIVTRSRNLQRLFAMIDLSAVFEIVENLEDAVRPGDAIGIDYAARGKRS
jgi:anti-anti-sigma factor